MQVNILKLWLSFNKKQKKYFVITFAMLVFFTNTNSQNIINPTGFSKMDTSVLIKWNGKYSEFIDSRDGKKYRIVKIGYQIWMAQNLAYKPDEGKYWVYQNEESNVQKFGYLYTWETAQKGCPSGWHLPYKNEFKILHKNLGSIDTLVFKELLPRGNSGFSVLSAGLRLGINFTEIGTGSAFWSSTENGKKRAWGLTVGRIEPTAYVDNGWFKNSGLYIRCIKDE